MYCAKIWKAFLLFTLMDSFQSEEMCSREYLNKNGDFYKKRGTYVLCMAKI